MNPRTRNELERLKSLALNARDLIENLPAEHRDGFILAVMGLESNSGMAFLHKRGYFRKPRSEQEAIRREANELVKAAIAHPLVGKALGTSQTVLRKEPHLDFSLYTNASGQAIVSVLSELKHGTIGLSTFGRGRRVRLAVWTGSEEKLDSLREELHELNVKPRLLPEGHELMQDGIEPHGLTVHTNYADHIRVWHAISRHLR